MSSNITNNDTTSFARSPEDREREVQQIVSALNGLRFGSVNVIVQDGVVIQIDRTEKRRLRRTPNSKSENQSCS